MKKKIALLLCKHVDTEWCWFAHFAGLFYTQIITSHVHRSLEINCIRQMDGCNIIRVILIRDNGIIKMNLK